MYTMPREQTKKGMRLVKVDKEKKVRKKEKKGQKYAKKVEISIAFAEKICYNKFVSDRNGGNVERFCR